jgi:hypothetical protein
MLKNIIILILVAESLATTWILHKNIKAMRKLQEIANVVANQVGIIPEMDKKIADMEALDEKARMEIHKTLGNIRLIPIQVEEK